MMAYEDLTPEEQQQIDAVWQNYGQTTDNSFMADMLRNYTPPNAQEPQFIGLDQRERLAKLLEKKDYQQPAQQRGGGMQMPNMDFLKNLKLNQGSNTQEITSPGTGTTEYAPFGGDTAPTEYAPWGGDTAATEYAPWGGDTAPATEYAPWGGDTAASTGSNNGLFGNGGDLGGGWASAFAGGLAGYNQGRENYKNDPNMWNQKDGFGTQHKDYRAEVGGGTLGGVMGYWGGPVGAALAGPTVKAVHPFAEKTTRGLINFGDKWGGATGASIMDPVGTMSSGKYKWGEIFQVPFTKNLFGW